MGTDTYTRHTLTCTYTNKQVYYTQQIHTHTLIKSRILEAALENDQVVTSIKGWICEHLRQLHLNWIASLIKMLVGWAVSLFPFCLSLSLPLSLTFSLSLPLYPFLSLFLCPFLSHTHFHKLCLTPGCLTPGCITVIAVCSVVEALIPSW